MKHVSSSINWVKGSERILSARIETSVISNYFTAKQKVSVVFLNENNIMSLYNVCKLAKVNQFMMFACVAVKVLSLPGRTETGRRSGGDDDTTETS